MRRITILSVAKVKESWLQAALDDYASRLTPLLDLRFEWVRDDSQLEQAALNARLAIGLDPRGRSFDSDSFARYLNQQLEVGGSRLLFVIGGPDGLPPSLRRHCPLLSLSPLTFTNQLARLVLVEQVYRAMQILSGSPYHR